MICVASSASWGFAKYPKIEIAAEISGNTAMSEKKATPAATTLTLSRWAEI